MVYIKKSILRKIYKPRPSKSHKYNFGYLLIVGGSYLYSGSPALAAMAALRAGVDLTMVIAPKRAAETVSSFSPNLIAYSLEGDKVTEKHLPDLFFLTEVAQKVAANKTACVIGGGMGRDEETQQAIINYLAETDVPAVVDADAIWAISQRKEILKDKKLVLTPHQYEFYILSGINVMGFDLKKKIKTVKDFAKKFKVVVLLKGNPDIISDGKEVILNKTGCPEMTVGGTGDTLAGICGCFLAQKIDSLTAASAAAYINGAAGEKARRKLGVSLLATDLIEEISNVIAK